MAERGWGAGHYLCGCNIKAKRTYHHDIDDNGRSVTGRKDQFGFSICPEHGEREYGWRTRYNVERAGGTVDDKRRAFETRLANG